MMEKWWWKITYYAWESKFHAKHYVIPFTKLIMKTVARQSKVVKRRVYWVEYPNSVWHMDSHHKLIRWRFVTHAAVDGFSCTIVYIKCTSNNKSETAAAVHIWYWKYGLPQRIRSDHGGENRSLEVRATGLPWWHVSSYHPVNIDAWISHKILCAPFATIVTHFCV